LVLAGETAPAAPESARRPPTAPPEILRLVQQQFVPGGAARHDGLERELCRGFDRLGVPASWIELRALTGVPEAIQLDPMASYRALEQAGATLAGTLAAHPELAALQGRIRATVATERTLLAGRRDDLGYRADSVDLARARYLRINTFRMLPGHDGAFEEIAAIRASAYARAGANVPWLVYQVNAGSEGQEFLVLLTLRSLSQYDSLGTVGAAIQAAQGEEATRRLETLEREALAGTDSEIYVVEPGLSHVPPEFAAADPGFWRSSSPARRHRRRAGFRSRACAPIDGARAARTSSRA